MSRHQHDSWADEYQVSLWMDAARFWDEAGCPTIAAEFRRAARRLCVQRLHRAYRARRR